ncbi:MAG: sulfite oxidase [Phycisphaerales bacterium]|nr:sulfite oxidase [Phycisphaerales bacterium]
MRRRPRELNWDFLRGFLADHGADPVDLDRFEVFRSRRRFFSRVGKGGLLALFAGFGSGADAALNGLFGRGLIPVALADEADKPTVPDKPGMLVHISHPISGEFPPHLLDDDETPTARHYVRNNGGIPDRAIDRNLEGWTLTIDGEVQRPLELSIDELKKMPSVSMPLLIECAGNGRALFEPRVRGNPWRRGAIACSRWTGVRLNDVLKRAGLKDSAKYTAHYGEDPPIGQAKPFSRGIPIKKAMDDHTIIAYGMNGEDLSAHNGYPVRLVVPGWVGSCSQKWLNRIWIRDKEHDSQKMRGYSYRVPTHPVVPGSRPPKSSMAVATSWIVKSLITRPTANDKFSVGQKIPVAGHAWAGEDAVAKVLVSTDYGMHWQEAKLNPPPNKYAWYRWRTELSFARKGYYEIWARAFDDKGNAQPFRQPWNPKGYLGNVIHRLPVRVNI